MCDLTAPEFTDEEIARKKVELARWPSGPVCPHCGGMERNYPITADAVKKIRPGLFKCGDCYGQFTVTVGTVDEIVHPPTYSLDIELEGELGQITSHAGTNELRVFDPVTDKFTTCKFKNENDAERLGALIRKRVRIYGEARYSREGHPIHIIVEDWNPVDPSPPSLADLHHARIKITNGERSEEVIRRLRDMDA